jgi:hypothetical protein
MTILLICWVCVSMALCLAFLFVAARPAPCVDEQMVTACQGASWQENALPEGKPETADAPSWCNPPAPPLYASTGACIPAQPEVALSPSVPPVHPDIAQSRLSPRCSGGKQETERFRGVVLSEVVAGLVLSSMLLAMTASLWRVGRQELATTRAWTERSTLSSHQMVLRRQNLRQATQATMAGNGAVPGKPLAGTGELHRPALACLNPEEGQ